MTTNGQHDHGDQDFTPHGLYGNLILGLHNEAYFACDAGMISKRCGRGANDLLTAACISAY